MINISDEDVVEVDVGDLVKLGAKYGVYFQEEDVLIDGDNLYFQYDTTTYDGEATIPNRDLFIFNLLKQEHIDSVKMNDFRIEIYFKEQLEIDLF